MGNIAAVQSTSFAAILPKHRNAQRGILALTTAGAILTLIPPCRMAGSLTLRSISLLSSLVRGHEQFSKSDLLGAALTTAKIAAIAVGIAGVAASMPLLITASVAADLGIQTFEAGKAFYEGDYSNGLKHLTAVVVDSLVLAALVTGSPGWLIAAASVNTVFMLGMACMSLRPPEIGGGEISDFCCYAALSITSIVAAILVGTETITSRPTNSTFLVKNRFEHDQIFQDQKGNIIGILKPGEIKEFEIPTFSTGLRGLEGTVHDQTGLLVARTYNRPSNIDFVREVARHRLPQSEYYSVPVGGNILALPSLSPSERKLNLNDL